MKSSALILLLLLTANLSARASVPEGAILHLDAVNQAALRAAGGLPTIGNGQPVDLLLDSSKEKRLATQAVPDRRPTFVSDGTNAYLKFDGKDDFIALQ